jgi:hypothetical protein
VIPGQLEVLPDKVAETANITCIGAFVELISVCAGMLAPPEVAVRPVIPAGCVTVQLMVAPGVGEEKVTGLVVAPEQIVCGVCGVTPGAGFTVKVNAVLGPEHPLATGVTV